MFVQTIKLKKNSNQFDCFDTKTVSVSISGGLDGGSGIHLSLTNLPIIHLIKTLLKH